MLENVAGIKKVILACGTVDLRKGIDGLAQIIGARYHHNPFEKGTLFLFCGRRSDRCEGLLLFRCRDKSNPLIRSVLFPQKRNSVFLSYGSRLKRKRMILASPSIPLRRSVNPVARYTFLNPV